MYILNIVQDFILDPQQRTQYDEWESDLGLSHPVYHSNLSFVIHVSLFFNAHSMLSLKTGVHFIQFIPAQ